MTHYQHYRPLAQREVRLIELERRKHGVLNDEILFSLRVFPINECPEYVALSYAWGDPADTRPCYCDNHEFPVAKSLHGALVKLRDRDTPSPIWIDVICINQEDLDEKSRQVRMMREIYFRATATIVWLGGIQENDIVAIELMHNLNSVYPNPRMIPQKGTISDPGGTERFNHLAAPEQLGLPPMSSPEWKTLIDFYRKPWFSRVWIIQELCAARNCVMWCGGLTLQPFVVLNAAFKMASYMGLGQGRWNNVRVTEVMNAAVLADLQNHFHRESSCFIFHLLRLTRDFNSTIPHDKLFALRGIADNGFRGRFVGFPVDYQQSIDDTLISFMRWALEECKYFDYQSSLVLLSYACYPTTSPSLPSWVPAWNTHRDNFIFLVETSRHGISGLGDPALQVVDNKVLVVSGKLFDAVEEVVKIPQPPEDFLHNPSKSSYWAELKAFFVQARHLSMKAGFYHGRASQDEALTRVFCLDCRGHKAFTSEMSESDLQLLEEFEKSVTTLANIQGWEHTPISRHIPWKTSRDSHYISGQINLVAFIGSILAMVFFRRYPGVWWQWLLYVCGLAAFDWTGQQILRFVPGIGNVAAAREQLPKLFASAWPIYENYADIWCHRSLCLSEGGRLCLVTERVRPRDQLCVLNGCGLVFALRSVPEGGQYKIVSDAHVQGCMQGEIHANAELKSQAIALV